MAERPPGKDVPLGVFVALPALIGAALGYAIGGGDALAQTMGIWSGVAGFLVLAVLEVRRYRRDTRPARAHEVEYEEGEDVHAEVL